MKSYFADGGAELDNYLNRTFVPEDAVLREIRERSLREGLPEIQVGSMDALHLELLVRASGAKKIVEIGTLGGYSGVSLMRGMAPGGQLYTFEYEPHHAKVAEESFRRAGFADRAKIFVGPAIENLPQIENEGPFDLVFCDADKESYPKYLRWAAENLRVGGVLLGDNTFGWGLVTQDKFDDEEDERTGRALQEFNREAAQGGRFRATILPTGEGLTFAVKVR